MKDKLVYLPIIISPYWSKTFEVMCDSSWVALGVVIGQIADKILHAIYYSSNDLNETKRNFTVTEQEILAVILL